MQPPPLVELPPPPSLPSPDDVTNPDTRQLSVSAILRKLCAEKYTDRLENRCAAWGVGQRRATRYPEKTALQITIHGEIHGRSVVLPEPRKGFDLDTVMRKIHDGMLARKNEHLRYLERERQSEALYDAIGAVRVRYPWVSGMLRPWLPPGGTEWQVQIVTGALSLADVSRVLDALEPLVKAGLVISPAPLPPPVANEGEPGTGESS